MGHQPYDKWIFERDELSFEQERQLSSHLAECQRCQTMASALAQVDRLFEAEPMAAPVAGFTSRWKRRLDRKNRRRSRGYTLIVTASIVIGLVSTAWLTGTAVWRWFLGAADQVALWIESLVRFATQLRLTGRLYTILVENFLSQVPAGIWISIAMLSSIALAIWIVSARKIVFQPE
jgi:hypothetical protein